jgi:hypothetical protein
MRPPVAHCHLGLGKFLAAHREGRAGAGLKLATKYGVLARTGGFRAESFALGSLECFEAQPHQSTAR